MIAEPMSFRCLLRILEITADQKVAGRSLITFVIQDPPKEALGNSFFEKGKNATGISLESLPEIKPQTIVSADVKFFGDPFHQNYQLSNLTLI